MVFSQLRHYPNVCRLCLKHPNSSTDQMVSLNTQEDLFQGTIENYINSITFDASEKVQLFPREVCLPCLETLRGHAKYRTKVMNISLLANALSELKYSNNRVPLENLFRTFLQELFKELQLSSKTNVTAADLISEFQNDGQHHTESVSLDDLALGQEIELDQDEPAPSNNTPENLPVKKRGRPRKEIKTLSCRQPNCTEVFHDRKSFEHHRWTAHKGFVCEECGQQCASKHSLDSHRARHRNEEEFQCAYCSRLFNVKKDLVYHIKQIHVARERFRCEHCGLEYKHKSTLKSHLLTHKEEFGFPCTNCDKKFKSKRLLNAHKYRVHSELSYPCDECGKQFRHRFVLLDHIERAHGIPMRFICNICVEIFDDRDQLNVHKTRHKTPTELECGTCLVVFNSKDQMFNHLCITYRDNYVCCGKDHGHHRTYNKHMFVKHGTKVNVRVKPKLKVLQGQMRAERKRKESCSKCDKMFSTRLAKQRHLEKCGTLGGTTNSEDDS